MQDGREIVWGRAEGTGEFERFMKLTRLELKTLHERPRNQNWGCAMVNQRTNRNRIVGYMGINNTVPEQVMWERFRKMVNVLINTVAIGELEALIAHMVLFKHCSDNGGGGRRSVGWTHGGRCIVSWRAVLDPSCTGFSSENRVNV